MRDERDIENILQEAQARAQDEAGESGGDGDDLTAARLAVRAVREVVAAREEGGGERRGEGGARVKVVEGIVEIGDYLHRPDPDVIKACRELLALAESGELRAILFGGALLGGAHHVAVRGDWGSAVAMLGCSTLLHQYACRLGIERGEEEG